MLQRTHRIMSANSALILPQRLQPRQIPVVFNRIKHLIFYSYHVDRNHLLVKVEQVFVLDQAVESTCHSGLHWGCWEALVMVVVVTVVPMMAVMTVAVSMSVAAVSGFVGR